MTPTYEQLTHGTSVTCEIFRRVITDAKISVDEDGMKYICQNVESGTHVNDKLGYAYSWTFEEDEIEELKIRLVTPIEPPHNWAWACEQMLKGKKVRRAIWESKDFYFFIDELHSFVDSIGDNLFIHRNDVEATDWEIYPSETVTITLADVRKKFGIADDVEVVIKSLC